MNHFKVSWLRLFKNLCIVLCVAIPTAFLFTANHLDTKFLEGELITTFTGKNLTISSQENYYSLCFFREAIVFSWSALLGKDLNISFLNVHFVGIESSSTSYLWVQNDIRQLATAILVLSGLIIWVVPWHTNDKIGTQNHLQKVQSILFRIGTLTLWGGLIYLRGNYTPSLGGSSLPTFVSFATTSTQEFWLLLLLSGIEYVFIGIFPVSILFIKEKGLFFLLATGIYIGWLGSALMPIFGEVLCKECIEYGVSPFR